MPIGQDNIIFLLGAGCSADAGIPLSLHMVQQVEELLGKDSEWKPYTDLYNYLRSAIQYAEGIKGIFNAQFTIERLLTIMTELSQRESNTIYPFIGGWNSRLLDVAGHNFDSIIRMRKLIMNKLFDWLVPHHYDKGTYYNGFGHFSNKIGCPLRIFTLNHEVFMEKIVGEGMGLNIEQGFDPVTHIWDYQNFDEAETKHVHIYLYKMHGSVDWIRKGHTITKVDNPTKEADITFGIETKLKSEDPFLFYTSEFRRWSLDRDCRMIVSIGYSFSDDYVNRLISQSLKSWSSRRLLHVGPCVESNEIEKLQRILALSNDTDQIRIENLRAAEFLAKIADLSTLERHIGTDSDAPFAFKS